MTLGTDLPAGNGAGAILRALGTLMAALGDEARADSVAAPLQRPRYEAAQPAPQPIAPHVATPRTEAARVPTQRGSVAATEADLLLSDARERAERILQESMERANDLLTRERRATGDAGTGDSDPLRRSVDELLAGMRDVQARITRIESLLSSAARSASPPVLTAPPRPAFPLGEGDLRTNAGGIAPSVPPFARPAVPPAPSSVAPPSAVPPMRAASPAAPTPRADAAVPPPPAVPEREAAPAAQPWQRRESDLLAPALATFTPADGSVLLRATPVSGFQGLMRLQDALQRIAAVRQVTVEAYAQGEARLRLELDADVDSDEIAESVGAGLGQDVRVHEVSEVDRTMVIALG